MALNEFKFYKLEQDTDIKPFKCSDEDLNGFLLEIPNGKRRGHYPALKIGRLAVAEDYSGQGLGSDIIEFVKYMVSNDNRYGCRFLTLDAYKGAVTFYLKCGFKLLSSTDENEQTRSMYFDLKTFSVSPTN